MNMEGNIQKKPLNYGRDGEGFVDLEKAKYGTMKKMIEGNMPKNKEPKTYDLAGNLVEETGSGENAEMTSEKIDAITKNIKSQVDAILAKESLYQSQGKSGDEVERLLDLSKQEILSQIGMTEEIFEIDDADSFELRKSKDELKKAVNNFNNIGKLTL